MPSRPAETSSSATGSPTVIKGGQAVAQPPKQLDLFLSSTVKRYNVRPLASARMVPRSGCLDTLTKASF